MKSQKNTKKMQQHAPNNASDEGLTFTPQNTNGSQMQANINNTGQKPNADEQKQSEQHRLTATTLTPIATKNENPFALINQIFKSAGSNETEEKNSSAKNGKSKTEKQIETHALIKYILDRNKKNVVTHNINIVPPSTQLYSDKYAKKNRKCQTHESQSQSKNDKFRAEDCQKYDRKTINIALLIKQPETPSQQCGKTLNKVYSKIKEEVKSIKKLNSSSNLNKNARRQLQQQQMQKLRINQDLAMEGEDEIKGPSRKASDKQKMQDPNDQDRLQCLNRKMISASGLTSYQFRSVRVGRNLGLRACHSQVNSLESKLEQSKKGLRCSQERNKRIRYRGSRDKDRINKELLFKESIVSASKKSQSLDAFLQNLKRHKNQVSVIYGEENGRLNLVNELMKKENLSRDLAGLAVDQIKYKVEEELQKGQRQTPLDNLAKTKGQSQLNRYFDAAASDEKELSNRRMIQKKPELTRNKKIVLKSRKAMSDLRKDINLSRSSAVLVNNFSFIQQ